MAKKKAVYVYESEITENIGLLTGNRYASVDELVEESLVMYVRGFKPEDVQETLRIDRKELDRHFRRLYGRTYGHVCIEMKAYIDNAVRHYRTKEEGMVRVSWL